MSRRLFAALAVPDHVREHLVTALRPIRERDGGVLRFTDPENWHITCAFYGDTAEDPERLLGHLAAAAAGAAGPAGGPLDLYLSGAGSFSSRTLWIGVGGATKRLRALMAGCVLEDFSAGRAGRLSGEQQRARQRAHLTVARAHNRLQDPWLLGDLTHALSVYRGPQWRATSVGLYESFLGEGRSGGPRYELIGEVEL
ncbi:RNA 2',3'-cyclic phosphodiesterase [Corynebacterium cystitidis]|uniref:RNA 2',3'-cyclic phosphodiesterase n=1 Tax=Corynebacterium cystitidis TaxID=35757 RepID=UPI00211EDE73|nr:RNA 2',3'-cyclic phosphodiesterase [Corynebacterium cystitidis]